MIRDDVFRRLARARDLLHSRYLDELSLEDLAREVGLSPYHLLRAYRHAFGETPAREQTRLRLERAKFELARGASVTEVCFEVGFSSLGSFSALFSREVGCPPSAFRRRLYALGAVPERLTGLYVPACYAKRLMGPTATSEKQDPATRRRLASDGGDQE